MTEEERAAFRAFVREHHPDRGGDPEIFLAGMARFRDGGLTAPVSGNECPSTRFHSRDAAAAGTDRDRYDAPVEVVSAPAPPVRVVLYLVRRWRRHRRTRVDRPQPHTAAEDSHHR